MAKQTSSRGLIGATLLALAFSLFGTHASADVRVVVRAFPGPGGSEARGAVVRVLHAQPGVDVVPNDELDAAAKLQDVDPDSQDGRGALGRDLWVVAWIEGSVRKRKGAFHLSVVVRSGADNAELARFTASRPKAKQLKAVVHARLWEALGAAILGTTAAEPEPEPPTPPVGRTSPVPWDGPPLGPTETPPDPTVDADPAEPGVTLFDPQSLESHRANLREKRTLTGLQVALTVNVFHRRLAFSDVASPGLPDYTLQAAPLGDLVLRVFPGAFFRSDGWSWIGLDLRGQVAAPLVSEGPDNATYRTQYRSYGAGLAGRVPLGPHELNAAAGYHVQQFSVSDAGVQPSPVPSVDYRGVRYALGTRLAITRRWQLGFEVAWVQLIGAGQLVSRNWFPRSRGYAVEGTLYADFVVVGPLSLRGRVAWRRFSFDLNPRVGDRRVAGGAVDDYLSVGSGLALTF